MGPELCRVRRRVVTCRPHPSNADRAILAAVDELDARREPVTAHLVDRVEWVMAEALNLGIPWDRMDEFRQLARAMRRR
jgi:hypothetical protein